MIAKSVIENIIVRQRKELSERPLGHLREMLSAMPYLSDHPLLIGGMRHSGRSTLLLQMLRSEYHEAWYTDFDDPRLAGFDEGDFAKLTTLIGESGKGVLLFDKIDNAPLWSVFVADMQSKGFKIVATVSLATLMLIEKDPEAGPFITRQVFPLSYSEFLEATRKKGGETDVCDYLQRGGFPEQLKAAFAEGVRQLYDKIITHDILVSKGVRDRTTLQRIALQLITASGETITANALHKKLKIKAVSTVSEHMTHLEQAGLINLVSILSDNPARQAVNPRQVYASDTALVSALSLSEQSPDREALFGTLIYNHLHRTYPYIYYTTENGGCDFVIENEGKIIACIQACYGDDYDTMQQKTEGLWAVMERTGQSRGLIVTLNQSDTLTSENGEIQIIDADYFLNGWNMPG